MGKVKRAAVVLGGAAALAVPVVAGFGCGAQRGGEAIPLERRTFQEVPPPPDPTFKAKVDAGEPDAEVDAAVPKPHPKGGPAAGAWKGGPPSGALEQLGSEWKRIRPLPMTEYDVNHTKGRKRQIMNELGQKLVNASRDTVLRIMGQPDSVVRSGAKDWGPTGRQDGRAAERLLYQWRGWKDHLIFEVDGQGRVLRSEWVLSRE